MTDFVLGYWGPRGRGQVARLVLAYTGAKWTNKAYTAPQQWFGADKESLGISFPNLPYLIHGDFKLTETNSILRYVARETGHSQLLGKNSQDIAVVDQLLYVTTTLLEQIWKLCFNPNFQTEKATIFTTKISPKLEQIHKFLANKQWALEYLTLADFILAEFSHYLQGIWPEEYKKHENLHQIRINFENLEQIKAYYALQNGVKVPFLPPSAKFH